MSFKIAILQPNYIPWRGYFDLINSVDEFVLYDDIQYTKRDWRNRNIIKTPSGLQWISVPVVTKGLFKQNIDQTMIQDSKWAEEHWLNLKHNYAKAPYFQELRNDMEDLYYQASTMEKLIDVNYLFIKWVCDYLGIHTPITRSSELKIQSSEKNKKLIEICLTKKANHYLSGPAAQSYLEEQIFNDQGVKVSYMNYENYPAYKQLFSEFEQGVTILDLLFNTGKDAKKFMKSF